MPMSHTNANDTAAYLPRNRFRHDGTEAITRNTTSASRKSFTRSVLPFVPTIAAIPPAGYRRAMCRNITELRGLEPPATSHEIRAAAEQFVRKVSGVAKPPPVVADRYQAAIDAIAAEMTALLSELPARRQPPMVDPPLRRIAARAAGAYPATLKGPRLRS
jgi:hypothetical protein